MVTIVNDVVKQGLLVERAGHWELTVEVEEIGGGVPDNVRQLIESQVDRLSREEQRVLEAASVAGVEFTTAVVAAALEEGLAQVEEWCDVLSRRSQLLRPVGLSEWPNGTVTGRYQFTHALYQEVLYGQVSVGRLVHLHRRIGECEEAAYGEQSTDIALELAEHFEQGRDYRRAVRYLQQAAVNDTRRYANREAIDSLTRALKLVERLREAERTGLYMSVLQQRGLVRRSMGDMTGAVRDFAALVGVARERGRVEEEMKALLYSATALSWIDNEQCLAIAEQAVALSPQLADTGLQVHARAYYGYWHSLLHGWQEADAQACAEAVEMAQQTEDYALLGLHMGRHLYFQCLRSRYREACRTAEEEIQVALRVGEAHHYMTCQFFRAWALLYLGRWGEMLTVVGDGEQMADRNGHIVWGTNFRLARAWVYTQAGDFVRARELSELGLSQVQETGHQYGQRLGLTLLGWAYLGLEEYERAYRCFREITHRPEPFLIDWIARMPLHLGLSLYWLAQKEFGQARQEAERLCALAAQPGEQTYLSLGQGQLAAIALAERNWRLVEAKTKQAVTVLEGGEVPLADWRVCATAGQVYEHLHQRDKAKQYWTRSAEGLTRLARSLGQEPALQQKLLAQPTALNVLRRARAAGWRAARRVSNDSPSRSPTEG
jgi:tetratricopeptide (TPR) repeat protein